MHKDIIILTDVLSTINHFFREGTEILKQKNCVLTFAVVRTNNTTQFSLNSVKVAADSESSQN